MLASAALCRTRNVALLMAMLAIGCGVPSFLVTPVQNASTLQEQTVQPARTLFPWKLAIIEVEGLLLNTRSQGLLRPGENDVSLFVQQLDKAAADPAVRAVVLRVNSPGGTVSASDAMYQAVMRFKQKTNKVVVASAQDMAASGAYYVACAADHIVVQPTSVVGSIGVIFHTFDFSGTLAKIGTRTEAIKSGQLKDLASPLRPLTDPERRIIQGMVEEYHNRFKNIVKTRRRLDDDRMMLLADGRIFTGQQALELGLADRVGQLPDAIELGKEIAHVSDAEVVLYKRPYGYGGSIYARASDAPGQTNVIQLNMLPPQAMLPTGFYYLWEPALDNM